MTTRFVYIF